MQKPKKGSIMK